MVINTARIVTSCVAIAWIIRNVTTWTEGVLGDVKWGLKEKHVWKANRVNLKSVCLFMSKNSKFIIYLTKFSRGRRWFFCGKFSLLQKILESWGSKIQGKLKHEPLRSQTLTPSPPLLKKIQNNNYTKAT